MKGSVRFVVATLAVLWMASAWAPAVADVEDRTWEIEVYLGQYDPAPSALDSDLVWGFRLGYNLSEHLNLFLDTGRFDGDGKIDDPQNPGTDVPLTYDARGFDLDVAWQLTPEKKWVTLLYGGIGWAFVDFNAKTTPIPIKIGDDSFTFNVGAAGKLDLKKRIYLRLDVRARWYAERDEDEVDGIYTIGIGWTFGA